MQLDYTVVTQKTYEQALDAVQAVAEEHGFTVAYIHDMAESLAEKGLPREPLAIVELCNEEFASQLLAEEVLLGLMLPCPVMVYAQDDDVVISTMRPTLLCRLYPDAEIEALVKRAEAQVKGIVDQAATETVIRGVTG